MHMPKSKGEALQLNRKAFHRAIYMFFLVLIQERTKENQGRKAQPDGCPRVEPLRDTIRHACGVTHEVSLTKSTATFHPRPIIGSGFYAPVYIFRSPLLSGEGQG